MAQSQYLYSSVMDAQEPMEEDTPFLPEEQRKDDGARPGLKVALLLAAALGLVGGAVAVRNNGYAAGHQAGMQQAFLALDTKSLIQQAENSTDDAADDDDPDDDGAADGDDSDGDDDFTCPKGYTATHLDMQNHDADLTEMTAPLDECAKKCDDDLECKGFEYNPTAEHCWVSRAGHHCTEKQHEDWYSCVKGGSDKCAE